MLRVHFLNHASVLIDLGEVRLLTDPWYWGDCFLGGWGLKYENPKTWQLAASATHLWVSHFHADHFHPPTLKRLLEINPDIIALGNESYNFQLNQALKGLGFAEVIPFQERKVYTLAPDIQVTRYPTTGIDNALWIESPQGTILNYNDCNLPPLSRKWLGRRLGKIDLILTNFNHAGKLLTFPPKSPESVKQSLKEAFSHNYESFEVGHIFPFASYHYYRAPESQDQNASLLALEELLDIDERIVPVQIGDELILDAKSGKVEIQAGKREEASQSVLARETSQSWEALQTTGEQYVRSLRQNYGWFTRLLPRFVIEISDLDLVAELHPQKGLTKLPAEAAKEAHIRVHSQAMYDWFSRTYGTDSFVVGAHFALSHQNKIPLKWQIVFGLLIDNKLSLRSLLGMLVRPKGIRFLWNRREEIMGILLQRQIHAEYHD